VFGYGTAAACFSAHLFFFHYRSFFTSPPAPSSFPVRAVEFLPTAASSWANFPRTRFPPPLPPAVSPAGQLSGFSLQRVFSFPTSLFPSPFFQMSLGFVPSRVSLDRSHSVYQTTSRTVKKFFLSTPHSCRTLPLSNPGKNPPIELILFRPFFLRYLFLPKDFPLSHLTANLRLCALH